MTLPSRVQEWRPQDLLGPLNEVESKNAPAKLYTVGDIELLQSGRRISIVGSRTASAFGLDRTAEVASLLVSRGITVVSGLALGVDTTAHRTTLERGGRTIAVLGTPLNQVYPRQNRELQIEIMTGHLAVSQFPIGWPYGRGNWPMRNRTMALITDATIIMEAGEGSGTLHQGWEALRLGRVLLIHSAVAADASLRWPREMMGYGAQPFEVEELDRLLQEIPERLRDESLVI